MASYGSPVKFTPTSPNRRNNDIVREEEIQEGKFTYLKDKSETFCPYEKKGEYIVQEDYHAHKKDELTIKTSQVVTNVKMYSEGWLRGEFNGKTGIFPIHCVKKREENESHQDKYAALGPTDEKHKYKDFVQEEHCKQIDVQARQLEKATNETIQIVDNVTAVSKNSFKEESKGYAGLFPEQHVQV
ncbi:CD2-associated protein-like [Mytilus edulis]|uniref:CD2-associated protein-like n=1 Tax=Mytilus edulis TaxID=6550 RepID=UPI0039EED079